jgi:hypothetical protein
MQVNGLEYFCVSFFSCERALDRVKDRELHQAAKEYMASIFLKEVSRGYSSIEMNNFVIPVIEKRCAQYHGILDGQDEPSLRLFKCGYAMIENIAGNSINEDSKNGAALSILRNLVLFSAKELKL